MGRNLPDKDNVCLDFSTVIYNFIFDMAIDRPKWSMQVQV